MAEHETSQEAAVKKLPMPVGGQVQAVVPQSFEEIFRIASAVVQSGLAPTSVVGRKVPNTPAEFKKQASAVMIVIMAGAELGIPAMSALRMFTVINGRPALFADGLIYVVRRSGRVKRLDMGFVPGKTNKFGDDAYGYCEAERSDTNEVKRVEFTVGDAKLAGLWDDRAKVERWRDGQKSMVDNDAPWHRYPQRMLPWRAAGYCLRDLFGDVLGGVTDEYSAREIGTTYEDITSQVREEGPPSIDKDGQKPLVDEEQEEFIGDVEAFLTALSDALSVAKDSETAEEIWDNIAPERKLAGDEASLQRAFDIKNKRLNTFTDNA